MVSKPPCDQMAPQLCPFYVPGKLRSLFCFLMNSSTWSGKYKKHRLDKRKIPIGPICIRIPNTNRIKYTFSFYPVGVLFLNGLRQKKARPHMCSKYEPPMVLTADSERKAMLKNLGVQERRRVPCLVQRTPC